MKTLNELVQLVEDMFPHLKTKDRLYIVALMQDEWKEGFNDARKQALEAIKESSNETD